MVLGCLDGSMVIFAWKKTCPDIVTVISSPLQIRFIFPARSAGMAWPSADPDTIDHSPCSRARSFLTAWSSAEANEMVAAARPIRNRFVFMVLLMIMGYRFSAGMVLIDAENRAWIA